MPRILRRPMFRKGGSISNGTGITSGMEPRQKFEEAGPAKTPSEINTQKFQQAIDYIQRMKQMNEPTTTQRIGDFLTAFGAGASNKPQTVGEALGAGAKGYAALSAQRDARADKYGTVLDQALLNKMMSDDRDAITKRAEELARINYNKFPGKNNQEKFRNAYASYLKDLTTKKSGSEYLKYYDFPTQVKILADRITTGKEGGIDIEDKVFATRTAETILKITGKDESIPKSVVSGYGGTAAYSSTYGSDILISGDGTTGQLNPRKPQYNTADKRSKQTRFKANKFYIEPTTGSIFQYQGSGVFKKAWP